MFISKKKFLATCVLAVTASSLYGSTQTEQPEIVSVRLATEKDTSTEKAPSAAKALNPGAIFQHNLLACLYLDPSFLKKLEEITPDNEDKKKIRRAERFIARGRPLPAMLRDFILEKLPNVTLESFEDPNKAMAAMREALDVPCNVHYTKEASVFHELIPNETTYKTSSKYTHYLPLKLRNNEDNPQKSLYRRLRKVRRIKEYIDFIPLEKLLKIRHAHLPPLRTKRAHDSCQRVSYLVKKALPTKKKKQA